MSAVSEPPAVTFLGGAGTVTGSKHLVDFGAHRVLLDCGLFQGLKKLRLRNWEDPPFDPRRLDAVVLSHAHIDHSGYLPLLVKRGFTGPVYCTPATRSLLGILLLDAAHIQEEEAAYANRKGYSKHHPALPLYTREDASRALDALVSCPYGSAVEVCAGMRVTFRRAGHIFGSATVEAVLDASPPLRLVFSGDLGRWGRPMLRDPDLVPEADVLLLESTYGDREHAPEDHGEALAAVVRDCVDRGGALLVPSFAVGRTQELIWRLRELEESGRVPRIPVYIDSPMATDVTALYCRHPEEHGIDMETLMDEKRCPLCCKPYAFTRSAEESKALNEITGPLIIIAGSGMATGGRILHHLEQRLSDTRTIVLLVGFQAAGTRGRSLQDGIKALRMHGRDVPVRARIVSLHGLSAHADRKEILRWLKGFRRPPRKVYLVHGEPRAAEALASTLREEQDLDVEVAADAQRVSLARGVKA